MAGIITRARQAALRSYTRVAQAAVAPLLYYEWTQRSTRHVNERPVEYAFSLQCLSKHGSKTILDVGSGRTAWPQLLAGCGFSVTAVDQASEYWSGFFVNRHHWVLHQDITAPELGERFDAVTCLSVIEHIPHDTLAIRGMANLVRPGGHIILSFPYSERRYVDNVYALPGVSYGQTASYICRVYDRKTVDKWADSAGLRLIEQRYYRIFEGDLWAFGARLHPTPEVSVDETHHLTCLVFERPLSG